MDDKRTGAIYLKNGEEILSDLIDNEANYFETSKLSYEITVHKPPKGTEVYNFLEDCHYTTSEIHPYVLTGTRGEQWVVRGEKVCSTYTFNGQEITLDQLEDLGEEPITIQTKEGPKNMAMQIPSEISMPIETSWGDELIANRGGIDHDDGDYIVCSVDKDGTPNLEDRWVVNGAVFDDTYDQSKESEVPDLQAGDFIDEIKEELDLG